MNCASLTFWWRPRTLPPLQRTLANRTLLSRGVLGRSSLTRTISRVRTAPPERLDLTKPEGISGFGLQVKVLYKKYGIYNLCTQGAPQPGGHAPRAPPGPAPPNLPHLPLPGVVSVETPESRFSLRRRCYPDNCDLALGGPGKDVDGCLFSIIDSKRFRVVGQE